MFTRKLVVSLDDETRHALDDLDTDLKALLDLAADLTERIGEIKELIRGEVTVAVSDLAESEGVTVFGETEEAKPKRSSDRSRKVPPPATMVTPNPALDSVGDSRVRTSPFSRTPRHVQVSWLLELLADGEWHAPADIARTYADDERGVRYMRHAVQGRMRELTEEGKLERRETQVKGSMFEYRLKK